MACYYVQQKNISSPTLLKTPCVHPHIFVLLRIFSPPLLLKYIKLLLNIPKAKNKQAQLVCPHVQKILENYQGYW